MKLSRGLKLPLLLALVLAWASGCKVSDDAAAASTQMTSTAAGLAEYYGALAEGVTDTIALYELDEAVSGIPFSAEDRRLPEQAREALLDRREMAKHFAELAEAFAALTKSKAPADAETAATALGNKLHSLKVLPGGTDMPVELGKAAGTLLEMIREHKEKEAARAMDETMQALAAFFDKERPVYDSLARTHLKQAGQVTQDLIARNAVDTAPMLTPALAPFGLAAVPPGKALQDTLKPLAQSRLDAKVEQGARREEEASEAMSGCLHEMSRRVHQLAAEQRMPLRGAPFSLERVHRWAESVAASAI